MTSPRALTAKQQEWISHLEQAQQQKLTLREYAHRAGIKAATLYAARKWLNEKTSRGASVPVMFAEARVVGDGPLESCVLHLAPGIRLQMAALPSPQWLATLCAQWERRS